MPSKLHKIINRLCEFSPTFLMISAAVLAEFLQQRQTIDDIGVVRYVRAWIRQRLA